MGACYSTRSELLRRVLCLQPSRAIEASPKMEVLINYNIYMILFFIVGRHFQRWSLFSDLLKLEDDCKMIHPGSLKEFSSNWSLLRHLKTHTGEKLYNCHTVSVIRSFHKSVPRTNSLRSKALDLRPSELWQEV